MSKKKHTIPNPNKMSEQEISFIKENPVTDNALSVGKKDNTYKGRMISMSDSFYTDLNNYLKKNPTEGNRSGFIVRVVADYIKSKTSSFY
jgi:hypothetical protein